jgi:UDP-N-acetylglucosamine 2-epimerase (non-hydrolysing)
MKIINVVGARPNLIKMAPIVAELARNPDEFQQFLVHTGQHYDDGMSRLFFEQLGLPRPDINLEVGSGSHGVQTGRIMAAFENVCVENKPDLVIVVGDVNSTMACAITAKKLGIPVAHVEAGLRSGDRSMPEEINRLCTDAISDYLFTTDRLANQNLHREGVAEEKIHFVGNVMIDTLEQHRAAAQELNLLQQFGLEKGRFATLTLHRPSNVDDRNVLQGILEALQEIGRELPIVFPIHPRTRRMIEQLGLSNFLSHGESANGLWVTEPLGYLEFMHLNMNARVVLTDSGGVQEETTALSVPCITLRYNTERPITCSEGTNQLVGNAKEHILEAVCRVMNGEVVRGRTPEKWDGKAAERIVQILRLCQTRCRERADTVPKTSP